jgi:2-oxoglutarate dehydrogenase E1 component
LPPLHLLAANSSYLETLLARFASHPDSVPEDWRAALDLVKTYFPAALREGSSQQAQSSALVRRFGHLAARLDPLGRLPPQRWQRLRLEFERCVAEARDGTVEDAVRRLLELYTGPLTIETGHIDDPTRAAWIQSRHELARTLDSSARQRALTAVIKAETFEQFMALRFPGKKRFGAEGAESLHALIQRLLDRALAAGIEEVIVGTMHRGRLGLAANLLGQSLEELFSRMRGYFPFEGGQGRAADVPYHLGALGRYPTPDGTLRIRLLPNPSHLEAVNAVALGYARSRQEALGHTSRVLPLILHTDASVVAQGVVSEALQLSELAGYQVGGAVNVIVNNQLGFTTEPDEGRTSRHCSAPWKAVDSLIAHVNADDVDAVLAAADLAFDYREAFSAESVVDLVCIRANGHNELDEPRFTQPAYYELAASRAGISERYAEILQATDATLRGRVTQIAASYRAELERAFAGGANPATVRSPEVAPVSGAPASLQLIADLAARIPENGRFHPKAVTLSARRAEEWKTGISWATAELLAFGAVLSMGWNVRLTGQDVDRGAFSQRHLSLIDTTTGDRARVFQPRQKGWGALAVHNTPLCEYAALSFEYGYSVAAHNTLTVWEAQFGDFANGAQIALDQFIASGLEKWDQTSGLVILLPHGLEGQGPEHSSARIERLLQLAAKDNLRIAHPSTPANYFHLLLSQLHEAPRRPLIVLSPKKLLRLKAAVSTASDLESAAFQPLLVRRAAGQASRVILCSGKIYYELAAAVADSGRTDVMLIRIEQLYPFPEALLADVLRSEKAVEVVWMQEEPVNVGAWSWIRSRLEATIARSGGAAELSSPIARPESTSPAGSFHQNHESDQNRLIAAAVAAARIGQPRTSAAT